MKNILIWLLLIIAITAPSFAAETKTRVASRIVIQPKLRHVVVLKFKPEATAADIVKVEDAFRALKQKIPLITGLEWGTNISPENRNKGFTHCFLLTFKTETDRDAYLVHPEHKAFGKVLGPVLADVFVVDYWAKE